MEPQALDLCRKNDEEKEGGVKPGYHPVTSTYTTTDDQPIQDRQYVSKVTGQFMWENGNSAGTANTYMIKVPVDDKFNESESEGQDSLEKESGKAERELLPQDLSMKRRAPDAEATVTEKQELEFAEESGGERLVPLYESPSEQQADRFCVYCSETKASPEDLQLHLQKQIGDRPVHCEDCGKRFKSSHNLQHHMNMQHGREPTDVNIAQRFGPQRKRPLDDLQPRSEGNQLHPPDISKSRLSTSPVLLRDSPVANLSCSLVHLTSDVASNRQKTSVGTPQPPHSSSVVQSTSGSGLDLKVAHSIESNVKAVSSDSCGSQDTALSCTVCAKTFPKPSDLKRHMMCHISDKPFRCEYCEKPFRAKSKMHYHLKATHGIEIELSPGLEERCNRMKARAHINMWHKGIMMSYPYKDNIDIDDIEDDIKSTDSSSFNNAGIGSNFKEPISQGLFNNSGIGSNFKEPNFQGLFNNTGIEDKEVMDLYMSDKRRTRVRDCAEQRREGGILMAADAPFWKTKISIQNETVVITRLDGFNAMNGENASIFKCYLCGKMFHKLSRMQGHLSLHFEKQIVIFECCFCNESFQFKSQVRNHIRRQHKSQFGRSTYVGGEETEIKETSAGSEKNSTKKKKSLVRCRFCRKVFVNKISLNKHVKLHLWNRNCFCRFCGKRFQHYTSLQLHITRFHWKTGRKSNGSWLQGTFNFFHTTRFHSDTHDLVPKPGNCEPLDLLKSKTYQDDRNWPLPNPGVTVVMRQSPHIENGEMPDTGAPHRPSENNLSESLSDNAVMEYDETGMEINTDPKRPLISFRGEHSPRNKSSRKSTPTPPNHSASDNALPLDFIQAEPAQQDRNNNESSSNRDSPGAGRLSHDTKPSIYQSLLSGYALNATNHLLMANTIAAHQYLAQHLNHTSQSLIYPSNHRPPNLTVMTQMMSLPMSAQVPSEALAGSSKSLFPVSHSYSNYDASPDGRGRKETIPNPLAEYPGVQWGQQPKGPESTFSMYCPPDTGHSDGRNVTSLSKTHSRLGIVHSSINREAICKPTTLWNGQTVYKCLFCSNAFVSFSDIVRHMNSHEGRTKDRPSSKCQYCDYQARTNSQLKVHMMRHEGIREFCCKPCNYKSVTQSDLKRHMTSQMHKLKSRNTCTYCGEGFVTARKLEKHLDGNC